MTGSSPIAKETSCIPLDPVEPVQGGNEGMREGKEKVNDSRPLLPPKTHGAMYSFAVKLLGFVANES